MRIKKFSGICVFIIGCIIAVWLFGILVMHRIDNHDAFGCFAATAQNSDCPQATGVLGYMTFHMNVFHMFSNGIFIFPLFLFLLLLFLFFIFLNDIHGNFFHRIRRFFTSFYTFTSFYFLHWLALHEKRDPSLI